MLKYRRSDVSELAKSKIPLLLEKRLAIVIVIAAVLLLYIFRSIVEVIAVMAVFIVLGSVSMMYNRWIKVSLGVEFIMLGIVVTGMLYGRWQALIVGIVALFFAEVLSDRFTYSTFVSFIGIFVVAMVIPLLITWVGIWMTLLYDVIILPGYMLLGSSPWRSLLFFTTHIFFNAWIFMVVAPRILQLLT